MINNQIEKNFTIGELRMEVQLQLFLLWDSIFSQLMIGTKRCARFSQDLVLSFKLMDPKCTKLKTKRITAKTKTQLASMMNILITMPEITGKHLNKLDKIAINPLELKIETAKTTNTNKT